VITSSAELANLVEETLRDEPTKSLGEEADVEYWGREISRKKKMNELIESVAVNEHSAILEHFEI